MIYLVIILPIVTLCIGFIFGAIYGSHVIAKLTLKQIDELLYR